MLKIQFQQQISTHTADLLTIYPAPSPSHQPPQLSNIILAPHLQTPPFKSTHVPPENVHHVHPPLPTRLRLQQLPPDPSRVPQSAARQPVLHRQTGIVLYDTVFDASTACDDHGSESEDMLRELVRRRRWDVDVGVVRWVWRIAGFEVLDLVCSHGGFFLRVL
jgi:hypothetical protein